MKIITEWIKPPVHSNKYDWVAYIEDQEESGIKGYGPTELEAVRDLAEQLADLVPA